MIVMANPDGVHIAQYKNSNWKSNSRGIDINRNFPIRFKIQGKKGLGGYSGKKASSEEETKAIIKLTKQLKKNQQKLKQNKEKMLNKLKPLFNKLVLQRLK